MGPGGQGLAHWSHTRSKVASRMRDGSFLDPVRRCLKLPCRRCTELFFLYLFRGSDHEMAVCSAVEVARGEEEVEAAEMAEADWLRRS